MVDRLSLTVINGTVGDVHDPVGVVRDALVVGHDDRRDAPLLHLRTDELGHLIAELGVERGGRLVEEHEHGVVHERPADGDALALTARELRRQVRGLVAETEFLEQLVGAATSRCLVALGQLGHHEQVLPRREEWHQVDGLEHEADLVPAEVR